MDYIVRVKITPSDASDRMAKYKPSFFTGEFVSRGKRVMHSKVETQVKQFLLTQAKQQNPQLDFDIKVMKIERSNKEFIVVEDKIEP
ncbi:MAG: hypothetical protein JEZ14_25805 [Marinilabiliaceae bacterium]|nr:hypothetical protein [Marinilabiliaceae bacterium]